MRIALLFLLISCQFYNADLQAQDRTIVLKEGKVVTTLKEKGYFTSVNENATYYYVQANKLKQTQGEYFGELLHGKTTFYDEKDRPRSSGKFKNGLRHGKWLYWDTDGKITRIISWKNGLKHGYYKLTDTSGDFKTGQYKKGKMHGEWYYHSEEKPPRTEKYSHGVIIPQKKKFKITPLEERPKETKSETEKEKAEKKTKNTKKKKVNRKKEKSETEKEQHKDS